MLREKFPSLLPRIAAGLVGHGSECFGFDDEISTDHDFAPAFCLFLTDEDARRYGFALERAYAALPPTYLGHALREESAGGGHSRGVLSISEFYRQYTGLPGAPETPLQWMAIPSYALAEATNGEVFQDPLGEFSRLRKLLKEGMPESVRLKKMAAAAAMMAQTGQYNYSRCLRRGEEGAAMLSLSLFVQHTGEMLYLLNRAHAPYYKWLLRGIRNLPRLSELALPLEVLLTFENDEKGKRLKETLVEDVASLILRELQRQGLARDVKEPYLERCALALQQQIREPALAGLHLMDG